MHGVAGFIVNKINLKKKKKLSSSITFQSGFEHNLAIFQSKPFWIVKNHSHACTTV